MGKQQIFEYQQNMLESHYDISSKGWNGRVQTLLYAAEQGKLCILCFFVLMTHF